MYSFIVLGIIPGTDVQITFELWLKLVAVLLIIMLLVVFGIWTYRFFRLTDQLVNEQFLTVEQARELRKTTQLHLQER